MTDKKHLQTLRVTVRVGVCVTLRSALSVAMAIVADAFANLIDYLEREEAVLKTLGATDLRACLRTGNKEETKDTERFKYYKVLNRIEKISRQNKGNKYKNGKRSYVSTKQWTQNSVVCLKYLKIQS